MTTSTKPFWIDPRAVSELPELTREISNNLRDVLPPPVIPVSTDLQKVVNDALPTTAKEWAKVSFIYFMKYYLVHHTSNDFAEAHYELGRELQDAKPRKRVLHLYPREHAKTTLITLGFTLWCVCNETKRNIVIVSDSVAQAREFLRNIKTELETNEKIIEDYGEMKGNKANGGKWDEQHVITANQIQIKVLSPNAAVRGLQFNYRFTYFDNEKGRDVTASKTQRPDLFILDDILNDKFIKNKQVRDKLDNWFFGAMINALDSETGDVFVIGTVIHHDDLLSRMYKDDERTAGWKKSKSPACRFNAQGEMIDILWPGRWPMEKLLQRKVEIGSLAFAREFLLNPVDEHASYFNKMWYRFFTDYSLPASVQENLLGRGFFPPPDDLLLVTSIDPNAKRKDTSDYTVVATIGFSPTTRCYYVIDMWRERPTPQQQIQQMIHQARRWGKQYRHDGRGWVHLGFVIETIAYQESIRSWLKKEAEEQGIHDAMYWRREENIDKVIRCSGMSPMVEQNRLYFPLSWKKDPIDHSHRVAHRYSWLEDELSEFPNGAYDDGVDAVQRAYSVLINEERKYVDAGAYGPAAMRQMKSLLNTTGFAFMRGYLKNAA